jgi:peptidoglycan-N-acetylglucosamine deacetylase
MNWVTRPHWLKAALLNVAGYTKVPQHSIGPWLTFDDGPHPDQTPDILELLQQCSLRACFFVVGRQVEKHPEIVQRIHSEGHLIGNHSQTHPDFSKLSYAEILQEMQCCQDAIFDVIGVRPTLMRPPYGRLNTRVWFAARQLGLKLSFWSVDSNDWRIRSEGDIPKCVNGLSRLVQPSDTLLLHDVCPFTVEVLSRWLHEHVERLSSATSPSGSR